MLRHAAPWLLGLSVSVGCASADPILSPGGPASTEPTAGDSTRRGGQSGSPVGPAECLSDADCVQIVRNELSPLAQRTTAPTPFTRTECTTISVSIDTKSVSGPACQCWQEGADGSHLVGPAGAGCYAIGRAGDCLWDDTQFAGCTLGTADSCAATCQELTRRQAADAARTFATEVLYAACTESRCHSVVNIDGQCFADRSYLTAKAYDCALGREAILAEHLEPPAPPETVPNVFELTTPGTNGFIELGAHRSFSGAKLVGETFSGWAQFFKTLEGESVRYGDAIDPLSGVDDCGVFAEGSTGAGYRTEWLDVASLELVNGADKHAFQLTPASHDGYYTYELGLTDLGISPRFGGSYDLLGGGGGFGDSIVIRGLTLPPALSVVELERESRFERGDLHLTWQGRSDTPIGLRIDVGAELRDGASGRVIVCLMADDGEFTIPASVLQAVPDGFATAMFRRTNRLTSAPQSGGKTVVGLGVVEITYRFALSPKCDRAAVMDACRRYAGHEANLYATCGTIAPPSLEELCPAYLSEACPACPEFFDCQGEQTRCENGQLTTYPNSGCGCP